jgi:hypothetical protein
MLRITDEEQPPEVGDRMAKAIGCDWMVCLGQAIDKDLYIGGDGVVPTSIISMTVQ